MCMYIYTYSDTALAGMHAFRSCWRKQTRSLSRSFSLFLVCALSHTLKRAHDFSLGPAQTDTGHCNYRGTSLIRNNPP